MSTSLKFIIMPDLYLITKTNKREIHNLISMEFKFLSLTFHQGYLTVICDTASMPQHFNNSGNTWRGIVIEGQIDFTTSGVLSAAIQPLSGENVSILVISMFDTDIIFVRNNDLAKAVNALTRAGHAISTPVQD